VAVDWRNLEALSPLAGPDPVPWQGWLVSPATAEGGFRLADLSPATKLVLHAAPAGALAQRLDVSPGSAEVFDDGLVVAGLVPGQWLVLSNDEPAGLADQLLTLAVEESCTVVDITHGRYLLRLTGAPAPLVLARLCATDLGDRTFPHGRVVTAMVAGARTIVVRDDVVNGVEACSYLLCGDRSQAVFMTETLLELAGPLGLEFEGASAYRSHRSDI
jgi:heterotetrameric sarcosine oxidase gamma subunit